MAKITVQRIYDEASPDDGFRVLVDRLWPRGISKASAAIDYWARDVAPSNELRKWFGHDPERWDEFQMRYRTELQDHTDALLDLLDKCGDQRMTLLFAARDIRCNHAVVLREALETL